MDFKEFAMRLTDYIREVVNDRMDLTDVPQDIQQLLYEKYQQDMPYGTQKARDGDPYQWITDRLSVDYSHLIEVRHGP